MVLVNWTRGSEIHFVLLLRDALEGVISRLVQTAGELHPVISSIVGDITSLGKLPLQDKYKCRSLPQLHDEFCMMLQKTKQTSLCSV